MRKLKNYKKTKKKFNELRNKELFTEEICSFLKFQILELKNSLSEMALESTGNRIEQRK